MESSTPVATSWPCCPSRPTRREGRAGGDLGRRGPRPRPQGRQGVRRPLRHRSGPRLPPRSPTTSTSCSRSTTTPPSTGCNLRTTNPIESTFATVRLRQRVTKGPGSRAAGIPMAFKLIESAQARWRAVNAPHWSLWSVPAPRSKRASSSNDPTSQEAINKSRDTPIHRS